MNMSRRDFVKAVPAVAATGLVSNVIAQEKPAIYAAFPSQNPDLVRDMVGASHARIDRVRELLGIHPALAKAAWDWGFGDWETALGAASHVGNREIAKLLVDAGARPDIYYHAMMGHLDAVKAAVTNQPGIQRIHGPHGITLLAHARNGGEEAKQVLDYLQSLGDSDQRPVSQTISDEEKSRYMGRFAFGEGEANVITIDKSNQGMLWLKRNEPFGRILHRVEEHGFAPTGSPAVRLRVEVVDGKAVSLTIHDPVPVLTAKRIG